MGTERLRKKRTDRKIRNTCVEGSINNAYFHRRYGYHLVICRGVLLWSRSVLLPVVAPLLHELRVVVILRVVLPVLRISVRTARLSRLRAVAAVSGAHVSRVGGA